MMTNFSRYRIFTIGLSIALMVLFSSLFTAQAQVDGISASGLAGIGVNNPTSVDFGPDGRLYVSQQNGSIWAFEIVRNGPNDYEAISTELINIIKNDIPNYNDDGTLCTTCDNKRQITGIYLTGTATNPIIYVGSSDYRIGGGSGLNNDEGLDTNSSTLSRLTWNGAGWDHIELVRGIGRSEENHAINGIQIDEASNTLYVAIGGFTNGGAPSNNFAYITEYASTAAILTIDLDAIDALPTLVDPVSGNDYKYNMPTLDDPTRPNVNGIEDPSDPGWDGVDIGDPFGGNDGLNQAKIVTGSPVQIYSPGWRNPYDIVITESGDMYSVDNGGNPGWGGFPDGEGTATCTNNWISGEPGSTTTHPSGEEPINNLDNLQFVTGLGYYGGHPAPTRGNPFGAGLFTHDAAGGGSEGVLRTTILDPTDPDFAALSLPVDWPPVEAANEVECDFIRAENPFGPNAANNDKGALATFGSSTNGITEYTASNLEGELQGDLLTASFDGTIYRYDLVTNTLDTFASGFGSTPLDVIAQGDDDVFPGTVWSATYGADNITVFEPADYDGGSFVCIGTDDGTIDEDNDGYTNADEIDNGTNPCAGAEVPEDFDKTDDGSGFLVSNLNDPDDDNDGLLDTYDPYAIDATNGAGIVPPFELELFNGFPGYGFYGLGFTGLMTNGTPATPGSDYLTQYDDANIIAGGTAGLLSMLADDGTAFATSNDQLYGFQFGLDAGAISLPYTIEVVLSAPFFDATSGTPSEKYEGFYIGDGTQDNYLALVLDGDGNIRVIHEEAGAVLGATSQTFAEGINFGSISGVSLYMTVNPATNQVTTAYAVNGGTITSVGSAITVGGSISAVMDGTFAIDGVPSEMAIGVIATSNATADYTATWDNIAIDFAELNDPGTWELITTSTGAPAARHESGFIEVGGKMYLLGGRGLDPVNIYDPVADTWTTGATPPVEMHHIQPVAIDGLIYVVAGYTGACCTAETGLTHVYIYDPANNQWIQGAEIPAARQRGSVGAVAYNNEIYIVGGLTGGHGTTANSFAFFDKFDPVTNTWTTLADAPRARDHFNAVVVGNQLYLTGGRQSDVSDIFANTIAEVDVYNFETEAWSTLPAISNIPTPRAGTYTALIGSEVIVVGGESAQTEAHNETQALNVTDGTWRDLAILNEDRHSGGMAICNQTLYAAAGAGQQGDTPVLSSLERFSFFGATPCPSNPFTSGALTANATDFDFGAVAIGANSTQTVTISNAGGTQALVLTSASLVTGTEFTAALPATLPVVIAPGATLDIDVTFAPVADGAFSDTLVLTNSAGADVNIGLSGLGISASDPVYRVNAGGAEVTDTPINWTEDDPTQVFSTGGTTFAGTPLGTNNTLAPDAIFALERFGNMEWDFPVSNGTYLVRFYFMEGFAGAEVDDARLFDISIEGVIPAEFDNFDVYEEAGFAGGVGIMREYEFDVADTNIDINFINVVNNAAIRGIEIIPVAITSTDPDLQVREGSTPITEVDLGIVAQSSTGSSVITLDNLGTSENLNISDIQITGTDAALFSALPNAPLAIAPTDLLDLTIEFAPTGTGSFTATLEITHDGLSGPVTTLNLIADASDAFTGSVVHRINVGGPEVATADATLPNWSEDTAANPSPYRVAGSDGIYTDAEGNAYAGPVIMTDPSLLQVPYAPAEIFQTERFDNLGGQDMEWAFDGIPTGAPILVRLYFAELFTGVDLVGERVMDVEVEGVVPAAFDDIDPIAVAGPKGAFMLEYGLTVADGTLNVNFLHGVQNPTLKAIEVIVTSSNDAPLLDAIADQTVAEQSTEIVPISVSDADGDTVTVNIEVLDAGLNVVDPTTFSYFFDGVNNELTLSPAAGTAGDYTVNVTADDNTGEPNAVSSTSFALTVTSAPSALVQINEAGGIGVSTFDANSFSVTNTGDDPIVSVTFDLTTAVLPNLVFDPLGTAGDASSKCLTPDTNPNPIGYLTPPDGDCGVFDVAGAGLPFSGLNAGGYNQMGLSFTPGSFATGETFEFSVDIDPTSIQGSITNGDAGAVSGLELIGTTVTVEFETGATQTTQLYTITTGTATPIQGGSVTNMTGDAPVNSVALDVQGVILDNGTANLAYADPSLIVTGPPNATVSITQIHSGLLLTGTDVCGTNLAPYESNVANDVVEYFVTLDGAGQATVLVSLFGSAGDTTDGFNYFTAAIVDDSETPRLAGDLSNTVILSYPEYPNFAPLLNSTYTDTTMDEGTLLSLPLDACDVGTTDIPTFNITFTEQGSGIPATFVTVVENGDGTGSIDLAPTFLDAGVYDVTVEATDGSLTSAQEAFVLTVNDVNAPPVIDPIAAQTAEIGISQDVLINSSDADGQIPALSVAIAGVGDPTLFAYSLTDNLDGTGTLTITPQAGTATGIYVVTVTADDTIDQTTLDFSLTVDPNPTPVVTAVADQTMIEGDTLAVPISATDDGVITLGVQVLDTNGDLIDISPLDDLYALTDNGDGTGTVTFTPQLGDSLFSPYTVFVSAADAFSNAGTETFTLTVNAQQAPIFDPATADVTLKEGEATTVTVNATDPEGQPVTYAPVGVLPSFITWDGTDTFTITPLDGAANTYTITVEASDGLATAQDTFDVIVNPNDVPTIAAIADQSVAETVGLSVGVFASDTEGDAMTLSFVSGPAFAGFSDLGGGVGQLTLSPTNGDAGTYAVVFQVSDAFGFSQITVNVTVTPNTAPTFDATIADIDMNIGDTISTNFSATDAEGNPMTFTASMVDFDTDPVAAGDFVYSLTDNTDGTGSFDFTPTVDQAGTYIVTVTASDGNSTNTTTFAVNIIPTLIITSPLDAAVVNGNDVTVTWESTGTFSNDHIHVSLDANPYIGGQMLNGSYTFTDVAPGPHTLTVELANFAHILYGVEDTITIDLQQQAPIFDAITEPTLKEGETTAVTVSATDPEGAAVTYASPGVLPAFITFDGVDTFNIAPQDGDAGTYAIAVDASDPYSTTSTTFTVTVNPNDIPVIDAIANQSVGESSTLAIPVTATDTEGDAIALSVSVSPDPGFISITDNGNGTGTVNVVPGGTGVGTYTVTVTATDVFGFGTVSFDVTVTPNAAPNIVAIVDQTVAENSSLTVPVSATDAEGDAITLGMSVVPSVGFITFSDLGGGVGEVTANPTDATAGTYAVTITATDVFGSSTYTFNILVTTTAPSIAPIADVSVKEGDSATATFSATDAEGNPISFTAEVLDALSNPVDAGTFAYTLTDNTDGTGQIDFAPTAGTPGTYTVNVTATDSIVSSVASFTLTVTENDVPVTATLADQSLIELETISVPVSATDGEGDAITLSMGVAPTVSFISFTDNGDGTGTVDIAPTGTDSGTYIVTITATDAYGTSDTSFTVEVRDNSASVFTTIAPVTVTEGDLATATVNAPDPEGDPVTLSVEVRDAGANLVDPTTFVVTVIDNGDGTGFVDIEPVGSTTGTYDVTVIASDGLLQSSTTFSLTVENNLEPDIVAIADSTVIEGDTATVTVAATDPESDPVTFSAVGTLPSFITFDGNSTFSIAPTGTDAGAYTVTVAASDGVESSQATFNVTIVDNTVPTINNISNVSLTGGQTSTVTISGADANGDTLTYSVVGTLPSFVTFNGTNTLTLSPSSSTSGTFAITVQVSDGVDTAQTTFNVTVTATSSTTGSTTGSTTTGTSTTGTSTTGTSTTGTSTTGTSTGGSSTGGTTTGGSSTGGTGGGSVAPATSTDNEETEANTAQSPVAEDDTAELMAGESILIDVLGNDTFELDENDVINIVIVEQPTLGTASVEDGLIRYTAPEGASGSVTIVYTINDSTGLSSSPSVVTVEIAVVNPSVLIEVTPNSQSVSEGESTSISLTILNDGNVDLTNLTLSHAFESAVEQPFTESSCPSETFDLVIGETRTVDCIETTITDAYTKVFTVENDLVIEQVRAAILIDAANLPPVANDDVATTAVDTSIDVNVLANDVDEDGTIDPASVRLVDGLVVEARDIFVDQLTGTVSVEPAVGYEGIITFSYEVCDDASACDTATVTITVEAEEIVPEFSVDVNKVGLVVTDEAGSPTNQVEWVVTVSNTGNIDGINVSLTDIVDAQLSVDDVLSDTGIASVNGQTVTVMIETLPVGASTQFTVVTSVPVDGAMVTNTVCTTADNLDGETCATAPVIEVLPQTGGTEAQAAEAEVTNNNWLPVLLGLSCLAGLILLAIAAYFIWRSQQQDESLDDE